MDIGTRLIAGRRPAFLGAALAAALFGLGLALAPASTALAQDKLVVGVDGTFAPHAMPKLGGGIEGFNIDMIEAIGRKLGRPVEIFAGEFSGLIPAMNAGKLSFVGAPTTVTPERAKSLLFTEGYLNTYFQFVVAGKADDLTSLEQLKGHVVSVNKGSAYEKWADANKAKYGFEVAAFPTNADAVQALLSGRAQSHLSGNTVAANSVLKAKPRLKLATLRIDEGLVWGAAFRKDDTALRNAVEGALECLKRDGTIAALARKWFDIDPGPDEAARKVYPGYGVPGLDGHDPAPHEPKC